MYIHLMALVLTTLSVGLVLGIGYSGASSLKYVSLFLFLPPVATYFGWFWLFGPEFREDKRR